MSFTTTFKCNFFPIVLGFSIDDNDSTYLAYGYPYTYTECYTFLNKLCKHTPKSILKRSTLCKSLAGNDLDLLLITNFDSSEDEIASRKAVILTARVHPGETNSSFIMHGLLEYLVSSNDKHARSLRNTYVFKVVPMLNPDGVIIGNYRCNLSGLDLNRQYTNP